MIVVFGRDLWRSVEAAHFGYCDSCLNTWRELNPHTLCYSDWRWNHFWLRSFQMYCWSPNSSTLLLILSLVIISELTLHHCHVFVLHPWLSFWAVSSWRRWERDEKVTVQKKSERMFVPKGLHWAFSFTSEAVRCVQEVSCSESDWKESPGHCKVWLHIMNRGHAGQNFKLVSSHLLIFLS